MKKSRMNVRYMVILAMFVALMLVLQITGIGLIPLPLIKATTMHIPVILGAILMGPTAGGILGGVFGLCSIWTNTTTPSALSFAFSPVLANEIAGFGGALASVWTALCCRILLGVAAGWLWKLLKKWSVNDYLALPVTAGISTILHSVLVMGSIGILFDQQFAQAKGVAADVVLKVAMGVVGTSGIPEATAAILLVTAVGKPLILFAAKAGKQMHRRN